tara:strand:+ start:162 stop:356 length:195 start_codon:yes stop_codon:yes gene_type:complete
MVREFFNAYMSRGKLTKDEMKSWILKFKKELSEDPTHYAYTDNPKEFANKYLNKVLDKIDEYGL